MLAAYDKKTIVAKVTKEGKIQKQKHKYKVQCACAKKGANKVQINDTILTTVISTRNTRDIRIHSAILPQYTFRTDRRSIGDMSVRTPRTLAILIESDALIIIVGNDRMMGSILCRSNIANSL